MFYSHLAQVQVSDLDIYATKTRDKSCSFCRSIDIEIKFYKIDDRTVVKYCSATSTTSSDSSASDS
jgi:hypothetical protein